MKAVPLRLIFGQGYVPATVEEATHVRLCIPGPVGLLTLPVMRSGTREGTGNWTWNGSTDAPTLRPSVKTSDGRGMICHSWINDGNIQFLPDSTHKYAGQTLPLNEVPEGGTYTNPDAPDYV